MIPKVPTQKPQKRNTVKRMTFTLERTNGTLDTEEGKISETDDTAKEIFKYTEENYLKTNGAPAIYGTH